MMSNFSPLFFAENWQLILFSLELYRNFGAGLLVVYAQSIIKEIFDVLKVKETLKFFLNVRLNYSFIHILPNFYYIA